MAGLQAQLGSINQTYLQTRVLVRRSGHAQQMLQCFSADDLLRDRHD